MSDFIIIIFLFPIFFMIHEFEEIIMIQKWINHNQIKLTQRFPHLYPIIKKASKIDTHKFSIIVAEEFIIVSTCCTISIYTGQIIYWYCCLAAFGLHRGIHLLQFIIWQ